MRARMAIDYAGRTRAAVLVALLTACAQAPAPTPVETAAPTAAASPTEASPTEAAPTEAAPTEAAGGLCPAVQEYYVANAQMEEAPADATGDPELTARWDRQTAALDQLLQWAPGALESGLVRLRDASAARDLESFDAIVVEEVGVLQELDVLCPDPAASGST